MARVDENHLLYDRKRSSWRKMRDCIEGSDAVMRGGEIYLPMPSGMVEYEPQTQVGKRQSNQLYAGETNDYQGFYQPWNHPNPMYSAYMQRSKFPDITANTLRGLIGIATKQDPIIELPSQIDYLETLATPDGMSLAELYQYCLSEVLSTGRLALVLDVRPDNTFYIAPYCTETYVNWRIDVVNQEKMQTYAVFRHDVIGKTEEETKSTALEYVLTENGAVVVEWQDHVEGDSTALSYQGTALDFLPIVNLGSVKNDPDPDVIPLAGVSDCALSIYRHDADLANAHFLTCNPTLVFTGVDDQVPRVIGSTVAIGLSNPQASAFYPATDTSALNQVEDHINNLFQEAMQYGSQLLGPSKRAAESGEALALRQAASGATLVSAVDHVSEGLRDILGMAAELSGASSDTVVFDGNQEFAEKRLTAQDITALTSSWAAGAISHETLLENFRDAGIVDEDKEIEDEMSIIETEEPDIEEQPGDPTGTPDEEADIEE